MLVICRCFLRLTERTPHIFYFSFLFENVHASDHNWYDPWDTDQESIPRAPEGPPNLPNFMFYRRRQNQTRHPTCSPKTNNRCIFFFIQLYLQEVMSMFIEYTYCHFELYLLFHIQKKIFGSLAVVPLYCRINSVFLRG